MAAAVPRGRGSASPMSSCADEAREPKWWHVADEQIEELVRSLGSDGALAEASASVCGSAAGQRRSVHFEDGRRGDALDELMRRTFERERDRARDASATLFGTEDSDDEDPFRFDADGNLKPRRWWRVSNRQLHQKIAEIADANEAMGASKGFRRSRSAFELGRGAAAAAADKIAVNIFVVESGDTMTMKVDPDLRLGPPKPPPGNPFTDIFGRGANTKGFDMRPREFDYCSRQFGSTRRPGWSPTWTDSLKAQLSDIMNVAPERQKLSFRFAPLGNDELTLRAYGIVDGETVHLSVRNRTKTKTTNGEVLLACTKRKQQQAERQRLEREQSGLPGQGGPSLRDSPHLRSCSTGGDLWMMPRWITQDRPDFFARCGIAIDGKGSHCANHDWGEQPIYRADIGDGKLGRIRESFGIMK